MVFFWKPAAQLAMRMETMRKAEAGLIALSLRFGELDPSKFTTELFDTQIPVSVLPFKEDSGSSFWNPLSNSSNNASENGDDEEQLTMHAIRVSQKPDDDGGLPSSSESNSKSKYPLVIVHGYMNGALYFYRNLMGLASYFDTVISVDLLGYGLSSRPSFDRLKDDSVETAEAFFVESLESWRSKNDIEKMTLAGHSMGGYLSVAYCEKYPERIDQLLLLSPAGVPEETPESIEQRRTRFMSSTTRRLVYGFFSSLWEGGYTPGMVMRTIPESQGRYLVEGYVRNRLPAIQDPEERAVLAEYMYTGSILPGSGEYGLGRLLSPGAIAKKPLLRRIPKLDVRKVSFLYGVRDWMDVDGGLGVQAICREEATSGSTSSVPEINVYQVKDAGHLLMLENTKGFNAAVVVSAGFDPSSIADPSDLPIVATAQQPPSEPLGDTSRSKPNGTDGEGVRVTA